MMKPIHLIFLGFLVASIFLPSGMAFLGLLGLTAVYLLAGFIRPICFDDISRVLGTYLMLILLIEGAHAITAIGCGIPIRGANVTLLGVSENEGQMMSGWVELDITDEEVDASPALQSQMSWIAAAGSLVLIIFGALYFVLPSLTEFPAFMASILFVKHQAPFLANDQSYMLAQGWMDPLMAWGIFIIGLLILILAGFHICRKKKGGMIQWREEETLPLE